MNYQEEAEKIYKEITGHTNPYKLGDWSREKVIKDIANGLKRSEDSKLNDSYENVLSLIVSKLGIDKSLISDGYHTFKELYGFRMVYNAALFNMWSRHGMYEVHKSKRHYDGNLCFGGGWIVVIAATPFGQISNHYEEKYSHLFQVPEKEKVLWPFDGHTPDDVYQRMLKTIMYATRQV